MTMTISTKKMMQQQSPFKLSSLLFFVLVRVAVLSFLSPGLIFVPVVSAFSVSSPMIIGTRNHHKVNPININSRSRSNKHLIVLKAGLFGEQGSVYNSDTNINYNNQIKNGTTYISSTSDWQIYVDQSKASLDRDGSATLDAFCSLCGHTVPSSLSPSSSSSAENIMDKNNDSNDNIVDNNAADRINNMHDDDNDNNISMDIEVQIIPALLPKPASGGKGPWIRCMWNNKNKNNNTRSSPNLDVSNVDSVGKVYRILTKHLGVKNISREVCDCLKWKYKGNNYLESNEIKLAIDSYNEALSICEDYYCNNSNTNNADDTNVKVNPSSESNNSKNIIIMKQQEGVVLLLRASAFLKQAQSHKEILQKEIEGEEWKLTDSEVLVALASDEAAAAAVVAATGAVASSGSSVTIDEYEKVMTDTVPPEADQMVDDGDGDKKTDKWSIPWLSSLFDKNKPPSDIDDGDDDNNNNNSELLDRTVIRLSILQKLQTNGTDIQKGQLRRIQYRHGLYQTSLLQATQDSLRSTELLPEYTSSWILAGELLSDLWKIKESRQYYEKAISLVAAAATTPTNVNDENYLQKESIMTLLDGLGTRQDLLDQQARANKKWSKDSIRLALDIAG